MVKKKPTDANDPTTLTSPSLIASDVRPPIAHPASADAIDLEMAEGHGAASATFVRLGQASGELHRMARCTDHWERGRARQASF